MSNWKHHIEINGDLKWSPEVQKIISANSTVHVMAREISKYVDGSVKVGSTIYCEGEAA